MFLPVASRLLLGLLCLNECIRPEVAAANSYNCRQLRGLPRGQNCNVQHYIDYLTSGKVTAPVMERCPVHRAFDSYLINTQSFQLIGKYGYYAWPEQDNIGALTFIASSRPKAPPQSAIPPRNRTLSPPKGTYGNKPTPARSTSKTAAWIKGAARAVTRSISGNGRNGRNGRNGKTDQIVAEKKHSFHGASTGGSYGAYHKSAAGSVKPLGAFHFPSLSTWNPPRNTGNQNWQPAGGHYLG